MIITTLIINFNTLQSHMHVVTIPCTTTSTLRYKHFSPRERFSTTCFSTLSPLIYSTFPRSTFDFFLNPSHLTFLRHFTFLLMTSFSATILFVFIISESPVHEGIRRDYFCLYLYQRTLSYSLPVSNVSCCISSHSSYLHRHLIKLFSPPEYTNCVRGCISSVYLF